MSNGAAKAVGALTIVVSLLVGTFSFLVRMQQPSFEPATVVWPVLLALPPITAGLIAYFRNRLTGTLTVLAFPLLMALSGGTAVLSIFSVGFFVMILPLLTMISAVTVGMRTNWEAI